MRILTASAIEVKSHLSVMITVSKEAKFKKMKIWITFYFSGRARGRAALFSLMSASASGARKNQGALGDERRSSNLRKGLIKMLNTLEF